MSGGMMMHPSIFMSVITPLGYHDGTGLLIAVLIAVLAALALGPLACAQAEPTQPVTMPGIADQPAAATGRDRLPA